MKSFLTGVNPMVGNFYICIVGVLSFSLVCFASQIIRMVRSLDEIKKEFKTLSFLVDGQRETAESLLKSGRWFK